MKIFDRNKTLIQNIFSLSVLNAINMFLPIISIPYLINTIGSANYGAYSITYVILTYVLLVGSYGFNCTSTRNIAQHKNDGDIISKIFICTIVARIVLSIFASILFLIVVFLFFENYLLMYCFGLGIVYGDILNPVWLYQGLENMKYMTIVNGLSKFLFTILIFVCIRDEGDYVYLTLLNSAGYLLAGVISFILALKIFRISYIRISISDVINHIRDGSVIFFSSAFLNLYNNSFVFILGLFVSEYNVGIYSAVDKIIKAAKSMTEPISVALFPHLANFFVGHNNRENANKVIKYAKRISVLFAFVTICMWLFSPYVCEYFLSDIAAESNKLLRSMSVLIFIGGLNYILGIVGVVNLGLQKVWFKILLCASLSSVMLLVLTVSYLGVYATVISSILAETIILIYCYTTINRFRR